MNLYGQEAERPEEQGYAMAALLVAMSIAAVMMTVAMPVWKQMATREKEEELVFRGRQYARAIGLFQRKYANATPPNIEVLIEQRFLRKKFKDPITNDDFVPIVAGQNAPGATPEGSPQAGRGAAGRGTPGGPTGATISPIGTPGAGGRGGIIGVTSKSKDTSIRVYNGRTHYNEWTFVYTAPVTAPGAGGGGTATPGQGSQGPQGRGQPQRGQPQRGEPVQPPGPFGVPGGRGSPARGGPGGRSFNPFQPPASR